MRKYISYFSYLIRHKYYVFLAGIKVRAPIFRLIIHDWSKFLPSEWFPYMNYFYGKYPSIKSNEYKLASRLGIALESKEYWENKFNYAWNLHQKRNKHHYQFWVLINDSGEIEYLEIPEKYIRELISDWAGAGKAITGRWEIKEWYYKNKDKILLHPNTRLRVEELIGKHFK